MSELKWKLAGKASVDLCITGWRMRGYSNEDILELIKTSKVGFDKRQIAYAKKRLAEKEALK